MSFGAVLPGFVGTLVIERLKVGSILVVCAHFPLTSGGKVTAGAVVRKIDEINYRIHKRGVSKKFPSLRKDPYLKNKIKKANKKLPGKKAEALEYIRSQVGKRVHKNQTAENNVLIIYSRQIEGIIYRQRRLR